MVQIILALAVGAIIGRVLRGGSYLRHVSKVTMIGVSGLLLVMGAQIGANPQVLSALPALGGRALVFAALSIAGSVLASLALNRGMIQ